MTATRPAAPAAGSGPTQRRPCSSWRLRLAGDHPARPELPHQAGQHGQGGCQKVGDRRPLDRSSLFSRSAAKWIGGRGSQKSRPMPCRTGRLASVLWEAKNTPPGGQRYLVGGRTPQNLGEQWEQWEHKPETQAGRGFPGVYVVPTLSSLSGNSGNTSSPSAPALRRLARNPHPPVFAARVGVCIDTA